MPTRVKICGITRVQDGAAAGQLGAHAVGLMFYEKSPRFVSLETAREVIAALPPFVARVGVFVNPDEAQVRAVLDALRLDFLQFHGDEAPEFCRRFGAPYLKAVRVKKGVDLLQYASRYHEAKGLLLDAHSESVYGGTGEAFDWRLIPRRLPLPVILSGGLNVANVAAAILQVKPWAVDVSSGVESAKGIKDAAKIAAFIKEARDADV
ncbi:MAG TPA: phosphoribosylanthranilate isomerase [Burkholderiales bacterium]|nr:phosphoribosylanthranilate isomerase [Burkholderiales bacterium]